MEPTLEMSVIIPVYRDWAPVDRCLRALCKQSLAADKYEVLVVSNDDAAPDEALAARVQMSPNIRLLHEPAGYSYAARNRGLQEVRGRVVAFTDADCEPDADWLANGLKFLAENAADVVGGKVEMVRSHRTMVSLHDSVFGLRQDMYLEIAGSMVTANLFVRRAVFDAGLKFDAQLQSGGDFKFCRKAREAGYQLAYSPDAIIRHETRWSYSELFRKVKRTSGGIVDRLWADQGGERSLPPGFWKQRFKPRVRYWLAILRGREKYSADRPFGDRLQLTWVKVVMFFFEMYAFTRAVYRPHRQKSAW